MRAQNRRMIDFLATNGIKVKARYLDKGSMKGTWNIWNSVDEWSDGLKKQFTELGFSDWDGEALRSFSSNGPVGSGFFICVRGHNELV